MRARGRVFAVHAPRQRGTAWPRQERPVRELGRTSPTEAGLPVVSTPIEVLRRARSIGGPLSVQCRGVPPPGVPARGARRRGRGALMYDPTHPDDLLRYVVGPAMQRDQAAAALYRLRHAPVPPADARRHHRLLQLWASFTARLTPAHHGAPAAPGAPPPRPRPAVHAVHHRHRGPPRPRRHLVGR
jgi:hypothetical protein